MTDMDKLITSIMKEAEKDGEPVTREEAKEMAEMEIKAKSINRYEQSMKPRKKAVSIISSKGREVDPLDRRVNYKIVLDTETAPCDTTFEGVSPWNMFVYDCGWAVVDKRGKVYRTRSFVNADIFLGEKNLMKSAYYANKIPNYWDDIQNSKRTLTSFYNIRQTLMDDIKEFEVTQIFCHNCYFDYGSLTNTERWETKSKYRYFFPKEIELMDTLKMARQVVAKTPTYQNFCVKHGYLTKTGRPKLTAEILYRYITGNTEFSENHTGLEDTLIEKEIMAYCYRKHKKMDGRLFKNRPII